MKENTGFPVDLVNALFFVESYDGHAFNVNARKGKSGGKSIAGVTDTTWKDLKKRGLIDKKAKRFNEQDEVNAGVSYFNWLMQRPGIDGDERRAVAAYHAGPSKVQKLVKAHGDDYEGFLPKDTQTHLGNVYGVYEKSDEAKEKYATDSFPTYKPVVDAAFNLQNKEIETFEMGGYPNKKKVKKASNGMGLLPTIPSYIDTTSTLPNIAGNVPSTQGYDDALGNVAGLPQEASPTDYSNLYAGAQVASNLVQSYNLTKEDPSMGVGIGAGAVKGAAAGATFGPIGAAVGGIFGAGLGFVETAKAKEGIETDRLNKKRAMYKGTSPYKGIVPLAKNGYLVTDGSEVQTAKGEIVALPDLTMPDVASRKKHKQMKKDEVTDLLPEGSYIFSNKIKLSREAAEKIELGTKPIVYEEGKMPSLPKKVTMGEFFKKKENTVSEVADNIRKKYKLPTRENDVFSERTKEEHKASRALRLPVLVQMNEEKKPATERQFAEPIPIAADGLAVQNQEAYDKLLKDSQNLDANLRTYNAIDLFQGSALNAMQNPNVIPIQEEAKYIDQRFAAPPRALYDSQINAINAPYNTNMKVMQQAGANPRQLSALGATQNAQRLASINQASGTQIATETQLERDKYNELNRVGNVNAAGVVTAGNQEITNRNMLLRNQDAKDSNFLQNLGNVGGNTFEREAGLRADFLTNKALLEANAKFQQNSPNVTVTNSSVIQPIPQSQVAAAPVRDVSADTHNGRNPVELGKNLGFSTDPIDFTGGSRNVASNKVTNLPGTSVSDAEFTNMDGEVIEGSESIGNPDFVLPDNTVSTKPSTSVNNSTNVSGKITVDNGDTYDVNKEGIINSGTDPYEYKKVDGVWKTKKKSDTDWIDADGDSLKAIESRFNSHLKKKKGK